MTQNDIDALAFDALNAACLMIQDRLGVTSGDVAGLYFSGSTGEHILGMLADYVRMEVNFSKAEQ